MCVAESGSGRAKYAILLPSGDHCGPRILAQSGAFVSVARMQGYYELVRGMIPDAQQAGIGLLAGSDSGANEYSVPGFSLHDELAELVGAGLTPMQVLQSATLNAARYLGITDAFGTVELGKTADLVLLEGNPLEDIRNTRKISAVVVNGKIFGKPELQRIFDYALRNSVKKRP